MADYQQNILFNENINQILALIQKLDVDTLKISKAVVTVDKSFQKTIKKRK